MKKLLLFLLCMVLMIGAVGAISVSAEENATTAANDIITFDGYAARTVSYHGVRSQYTLNTAKLATLEDAGYAVTIGMQMVAGDSELADDASYEAAFAECVDKVFYTTADGYIGSYYDTVADDNEIEFVYTITFK